MRVKQFLLVLTILLGGIANLSLCISHMQTDSQYSQNSYRNDEIAINTHGIPDKYTNTHTNYNKLALNDYAQHTNTFKTFDAYKQSDLFDVSIHTDNAKNIQKLQSIKHRRTKLRVIRGNRKTRDVDDHNISCEDIRYFDSLYNIIADRMMFLNIKDNNLNGVNADSIYDDFVAGVENWNSMVGDNNNCGIWNNCHHVKSAAFNLTRIYSRIKKLLIEFENAGLSDRNNHSCKIIIKFQYKIRDMISNIFKQINYCLINSLYDQKKIFDYEYSESSLLCKTNTTKSNDHECKQCEVINKEGILLRKMYSELFTSTNERPENTKQQTKNAYLLNNSTDHSSLKIDHLSSGIRDLFTCSAVNDCKGVRLIIFEMSKMVLYYDYRINHIKNDEPFIYKGVTKSVITELKQKQLDCIWKIMEDVNQCFWSVEDVKMPDQKQLDFLGSCSA